MNEDFVSFSLAKKLKEKGFPQYTEKSYFVGDHKKRMCSVGTFLHIHTQNTEHLIAAPTIAQVLKWLREDKDVDLVIYPIFIYNAEGRAKEYHCKIYAPQLNKPIPTEEYRNCHELAVLDGIEYVLDNLI